MTQSAHILLVEDAPDIVALVQPVLAKEGFLVNVVSSGRRAVDVARAERPDVVVLDLGLPDADGVEVCREIRAFSDAYIIMLTARDTEADKLVGLSVGADDYLTKPFSHRELIARIKAMLRRPRGTSARRPRRFEVGELMLDEGAYEVRVADEEIRLTKLEFELLATLMRRPREVVTREEIISGVWGDNWYGDDHVVDVHVSNLRKKLGDRARDPIFVRSVRGVGYRLGECRPTSDSPSR